MKRTTSAAKPKTRKCCICKEPFEKRSMSHVACGSKCAIEAAKRKREKLERRNLKLAKEGLKPRSQWLAEAQTAFNRFIRARDAHLPCISCGNVREKSKYNAGHYLSVGARPMLRFNEDNVHKQCEHCNSYLSGNIAAYRPRLIEKIGVARVELLEGPHEPAKYTIDDAKLIKAMYRAKLKELSK